MASSGMPPDGNGPETPSGPDRSSHAAELYRRISADPPLTQELFRRALQDPHGALEQICAIGDDLGLPVTAEQVRSHLDSLDDLPTKSWLTKARGGL